MTSETVRARGHPNVAATHRSTFEITRDTKLSPAGDCIIAVSADKAASSLSQAFRSAAARDDARITAIIRSEEYADTVQGWGSAKMTFADSRSMVFRVSDFVCGRTVMISADKAARGLDRRLIRALASGDDAVVTLTVERASRPKPSLDTLFGE